MPLALLVIMLYLCLSVCKAGFYYDPIDKNCSLCPPTHWKPYAGNDLQCKAVGLDFWLSSTDRTKTGGNIFIFILRIYNTIYVMAVYHIALCDFC